MAFIWLVSCFASSSQGYPFTYLPSPFVHNNFVRHVARIKKMSCIFHACEVEIAAATPAVPDPPHPRSYSAPPDTSSLHTHVTVLAQHLNSKRTYELLAISYYPFNYLDLCNYKSKSHQIRYYRYCYVLHAA